MNPSYAASTQGQLDTLGHALNTNILQNVKNAAVQAQGYTSPGAYDEFHVGAPQSTSGTASGTAGYDPNAALKASIAAARQGITGNVNDSVSNLGASYQNGVLGLIDTLNAGQHGIDQQEIQNQLAKQQGIAGVTASVARGIKSGGVTLANRNAGSSSAAGALADAYGQQGRQQLSQVGNQYAQGENAIQEAQNSFNTSVAGKQRDLEYNKQQQVNSIVNDAGSKLAALDAQIAGASLPDRIAIDQEKQNIRNQALSALQQYDQQLSSAVGGLHPLDQASAVTQARSLATAGTAPDNAFQFTESAPAQFGQGPVSSGLPLFTLKRNQQTA